MGSNANMFHIYSQESKSFVTSITSNSSESSRISLGKTYTELHNNKLQNIEEKRYVASHANMQVTRVIDVDVNNNLFTYAWNFSPLSLGEISQALSFDLSTTINKSVPKHVTKKYISAKKFHNMQCCCAFANMCVVNAN